MSDSNIYLPVDQVRARASAMLAFKDYCAIQWHEQLPDYLSLHSWAVANPRSFWQSFVAWSGLEVSGDLTPAISDGDCRSARFFPNAALNYARNVLRNSRPGWDDLPAITESTEAGVRRSVSRSELIRLVEEMAGGLRSIGVEPGDRVVGIVRNGIDAFAICLAASAVGATWSSVAPDLGEQAIVDRFGQLGPKVMVSHCHFDSHGVARSLTARIQSLVDHLSSLVAVVALDGEDIGALRTGVAKISKHELIGVGPWPMADWPSFPFNHPLFVLFSSGTTGVPKCLMHGAGGTLLEHYKELALHEDFGPSDKLYFHTSAGWMMWNWSLSALACGTEVLTYDGSPTFPTQDALLKLIDVEEVTVFGTSATYLHALEQMAIVPREIGVFAKLRAIQSTGSILYESQYDWIRDNFKHVAIHSISGGTDMIGCFVLGSPLLPIFRGDSQCVSLGLDVQIMTNSGPKKVGDGELICAQAFPSRPIGIYGDLDGSRFHRAYFADNPGVWTHGDQVRLYQNGAARILGRSDGTLKVRGVRIGPAEIYNIVLQLPGIVQALAVEQKSPRDPGGSRLILLIVLQSGVVLERPLILRIKKELSQQASLNHVPAVVAQVESLPVTHSGKLSERAVRDVLNGAPVVNAIALRNPEALYAIAKHPELQPQTDRD